MAKIGTFRRCVRVVVEYPAASVGLNTSLLIPSLAVDVPTEIGGTTPAWRVGSIAQGLFDAGVLQDADWNGNLITTINSSLTRWVNVDLGLVADLETLPLTLHWLDDMEADDEFYLRETTQDGAFVLDLSGYNAPALWTIGYWIDQFEQNTLGTGQDIYSVLCWACQSVFCGMTPHWAYDRCHEYADGYDPETAEEEMGTPHPRAFERLLPKWVYTYTKPNIERLTKARDMTPAASVEDMVTDRLREAAGVALEVVKWHSECLEANKVWSHCEFQPVSATAIRWQTSHDTDPTGWMMDQEMDDLQNIGEQSPLVALIPFYGPKNIPKAVVKLAAMLRLAQAVDRLLLLIEDERVIE